MNKLEARVLSFKSMEKLTLVKFSFYEQELEMVSLGLGSGLQEGSLVVLGVKSTTITLAKNLEGSISTSNKIECIVVEVENGEILTSVKLKIGDTYFESLITKEASLAMNLQKGERVLALIQASDLSLFEIKG